MNLFDASIFRGVTSVDGDFTFSGNPLFHDYNDFAALVQVGGAATIGGSGVTTTSALDRLKLIGKG